MNIVFKGLIFLLIIGVGGLVYALSVNILVMSNLLQTEIFGAAFGVEMTRKAVFVWIVCTALALWASFMRRRWRYILLLSPIYAPSLFALTYVLLNKSSA